MPVVVVLTIRPFSFAKSINESHSPVVIAIGFSSTQCRPAARHWSASGACVLVGSDHRDEVGRALRKQFRHARVRLDARKILCRHGKAALSSSTAAVGVMPARCISVR